MHEFSLCEHILRIVEREANKAGFARIVRVAVEIGPLSGASEESLAFCFPFVVKDTIADGATLAFLPAAGDTLRVKEVEGGEGR